MDQPTTNTNQNSNATSQNDESLKLAVAVSLLRSKLLQNQTDSDALRWKRKAKERKKELLRLRDDLREAEDASRFDLFPKSASCKCFFFDNLGKLSPKQAADGSHGRFNDILRRRFLRQVRLNERRRRRGDSSQRRSLSELNCEDELEQLKASVDFLVELCETVSTVEEANFANWSHQAVDFIMASLKNLLSVGKNMESVEGIISSLITRLVRRMCSTKEDGTYLIASWNVKLNSISCYLTTMLALLLTYSCLSCFCFQAGASESYHIDNDSQFCIQHLIRKLASESYIGQHAILSVSQRISVVAESLLFLDPFDDAFPNMHQCLFLMIQLIEFSISDYLSPWSGSEGFDKTLFEEWVTSVLHARKALEQLESRNGLYVLYMDRVTGELAKQVNQVSSLQKLNFDILDKLFL
ncbi:hypothetical protein Ddye_021281 [Dipteronia dyeriana]|uniref:Protein MULTIPOLAR SPINDLE 1 n=1 Tax=Dipteronia dyeriana TaxID=168575 RepID=A0AAD9U248_9ROSI|nr:hypothetical protein Ddye_021281 [Dipteronia dyeriana]